MSSFSQRHGYSSANVPITVREDAPPELRYAVISVAANSCEMSASSLRSIVCGVLFVPPDRNNWSAENVWMEVERLLEDCPWPKVYDIAEAIWRSLEFKGPNHEFRDVYAGELNRLFLERGIGWKFTDDEGIVFRGDETFGEVTASAQQVLADEGRASAAEHVRQALKDLSARPADLTGAIHHAAAALEATARDVNGETGLTLGQLIGKLALPKPLDEAATKLWGYASNNARHGIEGVQIASQDAQLVVEICCVLSGYLARRARLNT